MNDEQRGSIIRLVGDGKDTSSGGGLTLTDAFGAVLEYLMDFDTAPTEVLVKRITDVMHMKERRILAVWGSWQRFAMDIIYTLVEKQLVIVPENAGEVGWAIAPDFEAGKSYQVITANEINAARRTKVKHLEPVGVTVFSMETRIDRDFTAKSAMALRKARAEIERARKLDGWLRDWFDQALAHVEGEHKARSMRPPQPEDQPDELVECVKCGVAKPRTRLYYEVYWTRDRWSWRPPCKDCQHPERIGKRERVLQAVTELQGELGRLPTSDEVMSKTGSRSKSSTQKFWDELTSMSELPDRPTRLVK